MHRYCNGSVVLRSGLMVAGCAVPEPLQVNGDSIVPPQAVVVGESAMDAGEGNHNGDEVALLPVLMVAGVS